MSYLIARQRERIIELERMLSSLIDRNKALEEELKRLEARVEHLEPIPKRYTEEDWSVLQEARDLLDELKTKNEEQSS